MSGPEPAAKCRCPTVERNSEFKHATPRPRRSLLRDHPAIAQVDGYWMALASDGDVPARSRVDPRGIEDALEYTFVLELVAPQVFRFRIAGSHLNDLLGMDVRGMPISAMFNTQSRHQLGETLQAVCERPACVTMQVHSSGGLLGQTLSGGLFLAPLRDENGKISKVLGCLQTRGRIGYKMRRFDLMTTETREQAVQPQTASSELAALGFAEADETYQPAEPTTGSARPYLRVVADNT